MKHTLFAATALMLALPTPAAALSCGDTLSQDTTLTADLNCTGRSRALRIDTPGVVLKLNGYAIIGSRTGIFVDGASDVVISGPGLITGASCIVDFTVPAAGVHAVDADGLSVSGVSFANLWRAVSMDGVSSARILDNTVKATGFGFEVIDAPSRQRAARDNEISGNYMVGDPGCGVVGVWLEGDETQENLVYANKFDQVMGGVLVAASHNRVVSNTHVGRGFPPSSGWFTAAGIQVAGGSNNSIIGNVVENASTGVHLSSIGFNRSTGLLALDAAGNLVIVNRLRTSHYGILAGNARGPAAGITYKNRIGDNDIKGARVGQQFELNTYYNDARGNAYLGVGVPVLDYGTGNQWP